LGKRLPHQKRWRTNLYKSIKRELFKMVKQVKAYELRKNTKSELVTKLGELKGELQTLRIAQVTGGAPAKLAKIGSIRKSIARVLTVTNQITKSKVCGILFILFKIYLSWFY
jgi:ribosomal protein L29